MKFWLEFAITGIAIVLVMMLYALFNPQQPTTIHKCEPVTLIVDGREMRLKSGETFRVVVTEGQPEVVPVIPGLNIRSGEDLRKLLSGEISVDSLRLDPPPEPME